MVCVLAGLSVGRANAAADGQPPEPAQPPSASPAPGSKAVPGTPVEAYRAVCLRCHDASGRGVRLRRVMPELPDFTDPKWQASRTDAEIDRLIRVGTGKWMRPMTSRLGSVEVKQMVGYLRTFRDGRQNAADGAASQPRPPSSDGGSTPAPDRR